MQFRNYCGLLSIAVFLGSIATEIPSLSPAITARPSASSSILISFCS